VAQVQKEYRKSIAKARWLPECFREMYGSRGGASTVPNPTTSSGGNGHVST